MACGLVLGIDAANLRRGGGVTHLIELLAESDPTRHGFDRVIVWGGQATLAQLKDRSWLEKVNPPALDKGLWKRTLWQRFSLSARAREAGCDLLFVPGGNYAGSFHPVVTMSRNMLPFEWQELRRYGLSLTAIKLFLLRISQSRSFRRADGLIFLTDYARNEVPKVAGRMTARLATIPHGLSPRFRAEPKPQKPISGYDADTPLRIVYVSIIDLYKHQWQVVEAVSMLRERGWPVVLDLVGPANSRALERFEKTVDRIDPKRTWVHYHGAIAYDQLHDIYTQSDVGLFASSCENMPNILLETMAAGLPIASSDRGPMPEILGDAGTYFDPENPQSIAEALIELITDPVARSGKAAASFAQSQTYSWATCANRTFSFLKQIAVSGQPRK